LPNESDRKTGDVWLGGPPLIGGTTCFNGVVVGIGGLANADVTP
jgi:hypothetical protein